MRVATVLMKRLKGMGCTVRRLQAPIGGLLATLLPRAKIVPAVPLENISNDPEVVSLGFTPCLSLMTFSPEKLN